MKTCSFAHEISEAPHPQIIYFLTMNLRNKKATFLTQFSLKNLKI